MSIASEITRINDAKTSIKNSIINKGITVLDTQKIDEYSTLIDSIEIKKPEQSKSTTPSENVQNIIPDNGYTLSQVTVEAISKTYVGSNVTKKSAQTYIPTTTDQTIASGQYLTGTQTIKGDVNLVAENIMSGISIFGVEGTASGGGGFPNGTEWTRSNITSGTFYNVYNANGVWVGAGTGLYYSTDGKSWTKSNITSGTFYNVYNANGIWAAGGNAGIYYSTDGMTWTQSNITGKSISNVYNANGIWVASTLSGFGVTLKGLYYSTDGKSWTKSNITSGTFIAIYNANSIWVACSSNNAGLYYSTDGKSWTQSNITSGNFYTIYNANGVWVGAGTGLYYSTDGKSWTKSNITSGTFYNVYNANGIWAAGGSATDPYYSTDGKSWTKSNNTGITIGAAGSNKDLHYCNGVWVGGGTGLYYSTDGKSWTQSNITNVFFYTIYNANGIWVAGSKSNGLYYSVSWEA